MLGPLVTSFGDLLAIMTLMLVGSFLSFWNDLLLVLLLLALFVLLPPFFYRVAQRVSF